MRTKSHRTVARRVLGAGLIAAGLLTATACGSSSAASTTGPDAALVRQGEEVFQRKVGTTATGCWFCHGEDARGKLGPDIRGKTADDIRKQVQTNPVMASLNLSDADIAAVAAYLKHLESQP